MGEAIEERTGERRKTGVASVREVRSVCQRKVRSLILGDRSKLQNRSRHILATVSLASKGVCGAGHLTHLAQCVQPSLVLILNES